MNLERKNANSENKRTKKEVAKIRVACSMMSTEMYAETRHTRGAQYSMCLHNESKVMSAATAAAALLMLETTGTC